MKRAALLKLFIVGLALSLGAVGCKRGPKSLTYIPGQGSTQLQTPPPSDFSGTIGDGGAFGEGIDTTSAASRESLERLLDPNFGERLPDFFAAQTVYFAFDSSVVRPADVSKVEVVAAHLRANPGHAVIIEGHCDERGTVEYNRALGERRAQSVREVMVRLGADASRIHTISFGEDVPAVIGTTEAAYSQNRRGEFVLLRPKN